MAAVKLAIKMIVNNRIICPYCKKIVARIEDGLMIQGSAKCLCGESFGYSNVKEIRNRKGH